MQPYRVLRPDFLMITPKGGLLNPNAFTYDKVVIDVFLLAKIADSPSNVVVITQLELAYF